MADDKVLDRIKALLERAKLDTGPEAELAQQRAEEMIVRYSIDRARLEAADESVREEIILLTVQLPAPYAKEKGFLLSSVGRYNQCKVVLHEGPKGQAWRRGASATVVGHESDVQRVQMLYLSLIQEAMRGLLAAQARPGEDVATYRSSWMIGFKDTVGVRLKAAYDKGVAEADAEGGTSTALVLASRVDLVNGYTARLFPGMSSLNLRSVGSGYKAGARAGSTADIGHGRVTGGQTAIPG